MKRTMQVILGLMLSAVFILLLCRGLDFSALRTACTNIWIPPLFLALLCFFLGYSCRVLRWRLMLKTEAPNLSFSRVQGPFYASIALNNLLPFRLGDLARLFAFNRYLGISLPLSFSSFVLERLLDLLMLIIFAGLGCLLGDIHLSALFGAVLPMLLFIAAAFITLLIFHPELYQRFLNVLFGVSVKLSPRLTDRFSTITDRVFNALVLTTHGQRTYLILLSILSWGFEGVVFFSCALALPGITSTLGVWAAFPAGTLSTLIPSAPGYIGTFDYFTALPLTLTGNNHASSVAFAVLAHALLWFPATICGGIFLIRTSLVGESSISNLARLRKSNLLEVRAVEVDSSPKSHEDIVSNKPDHCNNRSCANLSNAQTSKEDVIIVGAGFTGLCAAWELSKHGKKVTVLEATDHIGGLASSFKLTALQSEPLDCFYHHLFNNDTNALQLIEDLGLSDRIIRRPSNTGIFHDGRIYKLSTPMDLIKLSPLSFTDRIRLGLLTLRVRNIKDWRSLEDESATVWLKRLAGHKVYNTVWEPLLKGKFGPFAEQINAVWFWNKLKLRGGSRSKSGAEELIYLRGSFAALAEALRDKIEENGGQVHTSSPVDAITKTSDSGLWRAHCSSLNAENSCPKEKNGTTYELVAPSVLVTTALPIFASLIKDWAPQNYTDSLKRVNYIGNTCLTLELDRALSDIYWLNVADPSFPFVGVIEHTNFIPASEYGCHHIVYLSKYLPTNDPLFSLDTEEFFQYALPYLKRIYPDFNPVWVQAKHLHKAQYSQHIASLGYSKLIPTLRTPYAGLYLSSLSQIYPEDRGVNYAIREGLRIVELMS